MLNSNDENLRPAKPSTLGRVLLASRPAAAGVAASAAADNGEDRPITILLVDDDDDCRTLVRDAIQASAMSHGDQPPQIVEMADGAAAVEFLRRVVLAAEQGDADAALAMPGLIFLDVEMPRMNGLDTLAAIKSMPTLAGVPVVMLTGVADEAYMRQAAARGANSYTIKPASAEQFIDTVQTSANYWLTIHQYPTHHVPQAAARR